MILNTIDTLKECEHISKAWAQATFVTNNSYYISQTGHLSLVDNISNILILLGLLFFFSFFYSRIIEGSKYILSSFFYLKELIAIESDPSIQSCRNIFLFFTLTLSIFLAVNILDIKFILIDTNYVCLKFLILALTIFICLLVRRLSMMTLTWINSKDIFVLIDKISLTTLSFCVLMWLVSFLIIGLIPSIPKSFLSSSAYICLIISALIYYVRAYRIIISNEFSLFFWIVYLCSLEVLPLFAVISLFSVR